MKTPEEIMNALYCCPRQTCNKCAYKEYLFVCRQHLMHDVLTHLTYATAEKPKDEVNADENTRGNQESLEKLFER